MALISYLNSSSSSSSSEEEENCMGSVSIANYLSNRKELAQQVFKSVKAEKMRMMLPQVLKKVDLQELIELCTNELNGMSKARILSVLNGKIIDNSSDTNESDNSGPSLEIISDTEEWLTDDNTSKFKEADLSSKKSDNKKSKSHIKMNKIDDYTNFNIKDENERLVTEESEKVILKTREADTILDLLELEMRARVIRALIRKEEDMITNTSFKTNILSNPPNSDYSSDLGEKKEYKQELEEIIQYQQKKSFEDEDVIVVVPPTPTIELSSDDESGNCKRTNKNKYNECNNTVSTKYNETKKKSSNDKKEKIDEILLKLNSSSANKTARKENKLLIGSEELCDNIVNLKNEKECAQKIHVSLDQNGKFLINKKPKLTEPQESEKNEKLPEIEEIIDLDSYLNDIDDVDFNETNQSITNEYSASFDNMSSCNIGCYDNIKTGCSETWATRYYQTDDVQHVIRESKMQSEIRKRLRERQRIAKSDNFPKQGPSDLSSTISDSYTIKTKPIGSVEEYLALKRNLIDQSCTSNNIINDVK